MPDITRNLNDEPGNYQHGIDAFNFSAAELKFIELLKREAYDEGYDDGWHEGFRAGADRD